MKQINWENKFSINVSSIDEMHKRLILIINKVIAAKQKNNDREKISEVLNQMTLYALSHFKYEEKYMKKFDYQEYQQHKNEHLDFLKTTVGFCQRFTNQDLNIIDDLLEYLKQWLVKHIQETDKKLTECFNKNGLI